MKKTQAQRRELLDRLEKKYTKKIQHQMFRRERDQLKKLLSGLRGSHSEEATPSRRHRIQAPDGSDLRYFYL